MTETSPLPTPTPEQRRVAAMQFERANQVVASGDFDYGIKLLLECCKIDPGNLIYRKALRQTQKAKHKGNLRGARFATVTTAAAKLRLKNALNHKEYQRVLEIAEEILVANPWDVGANFAVAEAYDALEAYEPAIWSVDQARQMAPENLKVLRKLAHLLEKTGHFTQAHGLWAFIRKTHPADEEAQRKAKDLAASETIAKGNYESVIKANSGEEETTVDAPALSATLEKTPLPSTERKMRDVEKVKAKIEENPQDCANYLQLAAIYRKLGNWNELRQVLEQGVAATGNSFELAIALTEESIRPFRKDLAIAEEKLQENPEDAEVAQLRVQLLKEINQRELDIYRQKADRYPTDMSHRLEMGIRLLQGGQVDEAISHLQTARTDSRIHWKALLYLGFCFKTRKNWRLAQRNFEDALRNLPVNETTRRKEVLFQLAEGCADSGDISAAIEWGYELANEDFAYKNIGQLLDKWQEKVEKE